MNSSSIRVSTKLPSNSVVDVETAPTPNSITSARLPASSVREISESLRIETTVEGSAYSGAGSQCLARSISAHAAEDEFCAGLVCGGRHRTVQLDHSVRQFRDTWRECVGYRDLLWAPSEPEDIVRGQPSHQQRRRGAADARVRGGAARGAHIDAVACDHGFDQAVAVFEFAFLVGVQVVTHGREGRRLRCGQAPWPWPGRPTALPSVGTRRVGRLSRPG